MRLLFWLTLALLAAPGAKSVRAHEAMSGWSYPLECCSGVDCAEVAGPTVRETPAGYVVTVAPGSHPMWRADRSAPLTVSIPYRKAKPSPDGKWHLCLNAQGDLLCFFAIYGGS
jgi:hypothetical protein